MGLPVQDQMKYWGIATVVFLLALWYLGDVMLPFVIGGAVAYCLDPIADWLEDHGLSRAAATVMITLMAVVIFILAALLVIPLLVEQSIALARAAPELFQQLRTFLTTQFPQLMDAESTLSQSLAQLGALIQERGGQLVSALLGQAMSVINLAVLVVVVPVVAFYLLLDWDRMIAQIDALLPLDHAPAIRKVATDIDATLASFIRGQGTVCLILGTFYSAALMVAGLQFGLIVGAVAGLLTFIPYVGALVGGALALGLAVFQFWGEWWSIAIVFGIFAFGQMVEGNILTPKLVGGSVGLHPVWLLFALAAFGTLYGFVGMLVAVPVAAMIGVLARFGIAHYKDGRLYNGTTGRVAREDAAISPGEGEQD